MNAKHLGEIENIKVINDYRYIVWTQAGFKKACRMLHKATEYRDSIQCYPTSYPSLVMFSARYDGYHYWVAHCTPLTNAIERARDELIFLETADSEHRAAIAKVAT